MSVVFYLCTYKMELANKNFERLPLHLQFSSVYYVS